MKILLPNSHLCLAIVAWQPGVRNKALTVSPPPTTTKSKVLKIEEMCQWPKGFRPDGLPVQSNDQEAMLSPTNARKGRLTNVLLQFKMHCVRHDHKPLCCVRSCQLQFTQTCTSKIPCQDVRWASCPRRNTRCATLQSRMPERRSHHMKSCRARRTESDTRRAPAAIPQHP